MSAAWRLVAALLGTLGAGGAAPAAVLPPSPAYLDNQPLDEDTWYLREQRARFLRAEAALRDGDRARLRTLAAELGGYPLYPYLVYEELRARLGGAGDAEIEAFLARYDDTPLAWRLRSAWLERLAGAGRWQAFLDHYRSTSDNDLSCLRLRALIETGREAEAMAGVEPLWLVGYSQSAHCDPAFAAWQAAGGITRELAWRRIELAMRAGRPSLARYLERFLDADERPLVARWERLRRDPAEVARVERDGDPAVIEALLVYGMERLAQRRPEEAVEVWEALRAEHAFGERSVAAVHRAIGLTFAYRHRREAGYWLATVPEAEVDEWVREWRVISALRQHQWQGALEQILAMAPEQADAERWRYWRARCLEALGWHEDAESLYAGLATDRSYYAFLAADRLALPYRLGDEPLTFDRRELLTLAARPAARRAHELFVLGRRRDARREWLMLIRDMDDDELTRAAKLADAWGWHGRAILTVARTPHRDDLAMRFPLAYRDSVLELAAARALDPAWIYAIVRQESAFMPDARSPKGALGLMQIMPGTGKRIARSLNRPLASRSELLDEDVSLEFGSSYLRTLLDRLDGHAVLATAAYNAGIHRVERWRPEDRAMDPDVWIESVPFRETREYLRRVLAYTAIYQRRLGREPVSLGALLSPIPARTGQLASAEGDASAE
ncbi:MAG: transglycosylase SLT domain-containing protein [Gammaproteobacteria bacterium]|nr:transglycosylase SLT domain-containing protein [Gammaproteobacteria bacterium]